MDQLDALLHFKGRHQSTIVCRECMTANLVFYWDHTDTYVGARCQNCGWQWWKDGRKDD